MRGLVWVVGLAVVLIGLVVKDMAKEEARARVERLPHAILRLAVRRLPQEMRERQLADWHGELFHTLRGTKKMPMTRFYQGIRFSLSLLLAAPAVARAFGWTSPLGNIARAVWRGVKGIDRVAKARLLGAVGGVTIALAGLLAGKQLPVAALILVIVGLLSMPTTLWWNVHRSSKDDSA